MYGVKGTRVLRLCLSRSLSFPVSWFYLLSNVSLCSSTGMNAVVWNDIAIDGVTSKHIKEYPEIDTELPSLQQFSLITVGIIFTALSGFIADWVGLNWIYAMCALIKLSATIATLWIPEKREKDGLSFREVRTCFFHNSTTHIRITTPATTRCVKEKRREEKRRALRPKERKLNASHE